MSCLRIFIAGGIAGKRFFGILNLPNTGQISNLPRAAVVETLGLVDRTGAHTQAYGALPAGIHYILERHVRNQEMTIQAALTGDRDLVVQVLLNDPLSSRLSVNQAVAMLDDIIEANRDYTPLFFKG
jgi:alpha-galactosidase